MTVATHKKKPLRTFGPVADLEKHLPADWWRNLFNSLYLKTDADVVENDRNTTLEVDMLLKAADLNATSDILDLCCGQGRHVLELHKRGYLNTIGIDRSRYLIRVAKKRAQQQGIVTRFSEGDARNIKLPESSLDCVAMFGNSFGYFESQEDDLAILNSIIRILRSRSRLVMDIVDGDWMRENFEPRSWEWIDENHFVCRERSLSSDRLRIISREVVTHAEKGIIADQFYAERLYSFEEIQKSLSQLGFRDVTLHSNLIAHSTRGQDLGMMANRLFISAVTPKKVSTSTVIAKPNSVLVLLGDPTLSDTIKRNGQFNAEDLETVEKLKRALATLNYDTQYLNSHKKIQDYFKQHKPSFVFNLCDEGYQNVATKELHIPALLEMYDIRYSGAGPSCLALCYNKSITRAVAQSLDIPVPLETYFDPSDQSANLPSIFPALLKPNFGDSSVGITQKAVVYDPASLVEYLDHLKTALPNTPILIQEFLSGNEYSVGVIGNPSNFTVLPVLKVDYSKLPAGLTQILGYESKWLPDSPYWTNISYVEAKLDSESERKLTDYSLALFERLQCKDYARFDFREDDNGVIKLLEVNPNPGWCWDGKLNLMAGFAGKTYAEMLGMVIEAAFERFR